MLREIGNENRWGKTITVFRVFPKLFSNCGSLEKHWILIKYLFSN